MSHSHPSLAQPFLSQDDSDSDDSQIHGDDMTNHEPLDPRNVSVL